MSELNDLLQGLGDKIKQQDAEQLSEQEAAELFEQGLQTYLQAKTGILPSSTANSAINSQAMLFTPLQYWLM